MTYNVSQTSFSNVTGFCVVADQKISKLMFFNNRIIWPVIMWPDHNKVNVMDTICFCGTLWERAKRKCETSVSQIKTNTHKLCKLGANHAEKIHNQIANSLAKNKQVA